MEFFAERIPRSFGGHAQKSNSKTARPLSTKQAVHLILKSDLAEGAWSFLRPRNVQRLDQILRSQAQRFGVRLYHVVNVGNHFHLVVRLPKIPYEQSRRAFFSFLRAVTGLICRHVIRAERGQPQGLRFWQGRPFTRLVSWGRDFNRLKSYMEKNRKQASRPIDWRYVIPEDITDLDSC